MGPWDQSFTYLMAGINRIYSGNLYGTIPIAPFLKDIYVNTFNQN